MGAAARGGGGYGTWTSMGTMTWMSADERPMWSS
jgi:hypothetical protein